MTQTESPSIADAWSENPVATAAAVALGIVIGAGAVIGYFSIMATGDEPPIRVRNGSIQLEVLHKRPVLEGSRQCRHHWKIIKAKARPTNTGCTLHRPIWRIAATRPKSMEIVIRYILSDDSWVQVESHNNKTDVTSNKALTRSADKKILSYGKGADSSRPSGWMAPISVRSAPRIRTCTRC